MKWCVWKGHGTNAGSNVLRERGQNGNRTLKRCTYSLVLIWKLYCQCHSTSEEKYRFVFGLESSYLGQQRFSSKINIYNTFFVYLKFALNKYFEHSHALVWLSDANLRLICLVSIVYVVVFDSVSQSTDKILLGIATYLLYFQVRGSWMHVYVCIRAWLDLVSFVFDCENETIYKTALSHLSNWHFSRRPFRYFDGYSYCLSTD